MMKSKAKPPLFVTIPKSLPKIPEKQSFSQSTAFSLTLGGLFKPMASSRRLAAFMFTDIVGYTAMMGKDEEKALALLKRNVHVALDRLWQISESMVDTQFNI